MNLAVTPGISLATGAFNLAEGQSEAAFVRALQAVETIAAQRNNVEVISLDPTPGNITTSIIAEHFPHVRNFHLPGKKKKKSNLKSIFSWLYRYT